LKTYLWSFTPLVGIYYDINFKFNQITFKLMLDRLSKFKDKNKALEQERNTTSHIKKTINLQNSLDYITIDEFLHLMDTVYEKGKIDFLVRGVQTNKMIENAMKYDKIYKKQVVKEKVQEGAEELSEESFDEEEEEKEANVELLDGQTPAGTPLLFVCIDNEPVDQEEEWLLEDFFSKLLRVGIDPNQYWDMQSSYAINYALENERFRSVSLLLEFK
jgi:hypothetical protein